MGSAECEVSFMYIDDEFSLVEPLRATCVFHVTLFVVLPKWALFAQYRKAFFFLFCAKIVLCLVCKKRVKWSLFFTEKENFGYKLHFMAVF